MTAIFDHMQLCRLCLIKDKVNVPIFGDRQLFLKITACLPVKVTEDDNLPKNICDNCFYKVDSLYQFWNTTVNAEKQLLQWLAEIGVDVNIKNSNTPQVRMTPQSHAHPHSMIPETIILKEERQDPDLASGEQNTENKNVFSGYEMPYQNQTNTAVGVTTNFKQPVEAPTEEEEKVSQQTPAKRRGRPPKQKTPPSTTITAPAVPEPTITPTKRRSSAAAAAAAVAAAAANASSDESDIDDRLGDDDSDDEDMDVSIAKEEADSEDEEYMDNPDALEPTAFVGVPSTSGCDSEKPGPSGLGAGTTGKTTLPSNSTNETGNILMKMLMDTKLNFKYPDLTKEETRKKSKTDRIKELVCPKCNLQCESKLDLKKHSESHLDCKPEECPACGKLYRNKWITMRHYRVIHLKTVTYDCTICGASLATKASLESHMLRHSKEYTHHCEKCSRGFYKKSDLDEHIRIEHDGVRYICFPCNKVFKNKGYFVAHAKNHKPSSTKFTCRMCNEMFAYKRELFLHKKKHRKKESYICDICGKTVSSYSSLVNHKRRHNGESRFTCPTCGKKCITSNCYKTHIRVHTKEKPFICSNCGKTFTQKSSLNIHVRLHTGERPYPCSICEKKFVSKSALKLHSKIHGTALADIKL